MDIAHIPTHGYKLVKREEVEALTIPQIMILIDRTRNNIWTRRFTLIRQDELPTMRANLLLLREILREKRKKDI